MGDVVPMLRRRISQLSTVELRDIANEPPCWFAINDDELVMAVVSVLAPAGWSDAETMCLAVDAAGRILSKLLDNVYGQDTA